MISKPRCEIRATADPSGFRRSLAAWFERNGRDLPWRRTNDPYAVLVSEMMLQQTQVATVLAGSYYQKFLATFPTAEVLAVASDDALLKAWEGLGYYRRVRLLRDAARAVVDRHGGHFPSDLDALLALPGVGRYTAGALRAFAFDLPAVLVDGNIARVIARLTNCHKPIDASAGTAAVWKTAGQLACDNAPRVHHSALMELGQKICRPGVPTCHHCPVAGWCATRAPDKLPVKLGKTRITQVKEHAVLLRDRGGCILLHRERGSRRQGMWRLPLREADEVRDLPVVDREQYTITRYKVELLVHDAATLQPAIAPAEGEVWIAPDAVTALPMSAPCRRVISRLLGFANESM